MSGTIVRRSHDVLSRRVGAVWLVTTPGDPEMHELSGGAAVVWDRLAEPLPVEVLVGDLVDEGAPPRDILSCLVDLYLIDAIGREPA